MVSLSLGALRVGAGIVRPAEAETAPTPPPPPRAIVKIESIESRSEKEMDAEVTWFGIYAEEVSEALSAQLGLNSGEGLVITYVAPDSPALKAGLQKNDVLVALRDQLLVHPLQLVKLIRSHKEGDTINVTFYRQGRKQTASATLVKRPPTTSAWTMLLPADAASVAVWKSNSAAEVRDGIHSHAKQLQEELVRHGADKQKVTLEVERSLEEARKALQDALRHKGQSGAVIGLDPKELEALTATGVDIGENSTVVVKKNGQTVRTIVQADETGSYVITALPKKRLSAHDKEGNLIFDGEIETPEQQKQVPSAVWEKVKPLLEQLKPLDDGKTLKPNAQSDPVPELETTPALKTSCQSPANHPWVNHERTDCRPT